MAFNPDLAKARSDALRAEISSRTIQEQELFNEWLVMTGTAATLSVARRWTSNTVSQQRNFINRNIGELDLDFRSDVVRLLIELPFPQYPTKQLEMLDPLVQRDVDKFMQYYSDFWISQLAAHLQLSPGGIIFYWAMDSDSAPDYIPQEAGEEDELAP